MENPTCNCEEMADDGERSWKCPVHGKMYFDNTTGEIKKDEGE